MNALRRLCGLLVAVAMTATACRSEMRDMNQDRDRTQVFDTPDEAVAKARQDFLEVLATDLGLNLGVDAATLERATPGAAVRRVDVDFERLLTAQPADSFAALVQAERNTVVPLVADNRVATIVEIVRAEQGWRVVGLAGTDIASELSAIRESAPQVAELPDQAITLYEIPNLQTRVYGVRTPDAELFFTDHGDFSIRQAVSAERLIPALRTDAAEFQRRFGDTLRQRPLLR